MNDRFKFRIWDKKLKKIAKWGDNPYHNMEIMNYICVENPVTDWRHEDYILMQCTGLKDKNGKLIYEGDVVKINTHYNHLVCDDYEYNCESEKGYSLFKIIYDDDMARFGAERIKCVKWETHHYSLDYVPHNHKVIGNIYENKELLESEG